MSNCPCCATPMLHHIRANQTYWFCRSCWQEMPIVDLSSHSLLSATKLRSSIGLNASDRSLLTTLSVSLPSRF